jgi:peptide-methionine (R)-S-oxide reductase
MLLVMLPLLLAGCSRTPPPQIGPGQTTTAVDAMPRSTTKTPSGENKAMSGSFERSDEQWRQLLTPEQYYVLRQQGTEAPFTNKYDHHFKPGTYACAGCGQELFSSNTKFNSGCGWPAFYAAQAGDRVKLTPDLSHGMVRTEVTCSRCDSHLGHIFDDAPQTPTGQRYCINSVSLNFIPAKDEQQTSREP